MIDQPSEPAAADNRRDELGAGAQSKGEGAVAFRRSDADPLGPASPCAARSRAVAIRSSRSFGFSGMP